MKKRITKKDMEKVHPYIPEVYTRLQQGRVSRREFLRTATLLGMSGWGGRHSQCLRGAASHRRNGRRRVEEAVATVADTPEPVVAATQEVVEEVAKGTGTRRHAADWLSRSRPSIIRPASHGQRAPTPYGKSSSTWQRPIKITLPVPFCWKVGTPVMT